MRVLLVEDDTSVAKSIELMLQAEGFIVDTTDLGEDGLEIGKLYDYDIIILDLMLPDIDGYEVLRRLRAARRGGRRAGSRRASIRGRACAAGGSSSRGAERCLSTWTGRSRACGMRR